MLTYYTKEGNCTADSEIFDTASVSVKVFDEELYIAVTYYNDITSNNGVAHTIWVDAKGPEQKMYRFLWYKSSFSFYEYRKLQDGTEEWIPGYYFDIKQVDAIRKPDYILCRSSFYNDVCSRTNY